MSTSITTRCENNTDTRSISDHTKTTSDSIELNASDAVNASSTNGTVHSESAAYAFATGSNLKTLSISIHHANKETCGSNLQIHFNIEEELSEGKSSAIKVDHESSEQTDVTRLIPRSVDQWAKQKHGISMMKNQEHNTSADNYPVEPPKPDMEEVVNIETASLGTVEQNILTTLAFLVDAFFEEVKEQQKNIFIINDRPNVSNIAEHLADLATEACRGNKISGQTKENIRKLIARAMKEKNLKIK